MSFFWFGHFEFFFRKKKNFFCFIPMKISPNLYGRMDGSKFWCFPWFPENSLLCVILCYTVYIFFKLVCTHYVVNELNIKFVDVYEINLDIWPGADWNEKKNLLVWCLDQGTYLDTGASIYYLQAPSMIVGGSPCILRQWDLTESKSCIGFT